MDPKSQTVILPRPLTLSALGALLAHMKAGIIAPEATLRMSQQNPPPGTPVYMAENRVVNLMAYDIHHESARKIISEAPAEIRRWINWLSFGGSESGHDYLSYVFTQMHRQWIGREHIIAARFIEWTEAHKYIDPWKKDSADQWWTGIETMLSESIPSATPAFEHIPQDKRFVHLPCFSEKPQQASEEDISRDPARPDNEITGTVQLQLNEGNVLQLAEQSITIGIGGIANSGKSTLTVSLAAEIDAVLRSLETRSGWPKIGISVGVVNLDLATPTTDAISTGGGRDRNKLVTLKQKWSIELAEEARVKLEQARSKYNIVLCDLPGGKPDDITRVIAAGLDAGIIITKDWKEAMETWPALYKSLGVKIVSRIRSRLPHEGFSSLMTHRRAGERISGRVSGLFRSTKAWDKFVEYLALFLLFEILPNLYGRPLPEDSENVQK